MPVYETYSRRKKRLEQKEPDVYQYESIPETVRTQIRHIWDGAIGPYWEPHGYAFGSTPKNNNRGWNLIRDAVCREHGTLSLANEKNPKKDCIAYLMREDDTDKLLDLIEFCFRYINLQKKEMEYERLRLGIEQDPNDAINELNFRLREAAVGYQFEQDQVVRVDSELVHAEVVQPALQLLRDPRFAGPEEEFRAAHAHYRAGECKDAITDALNAFESTMKAICDIKGWPYNKGARASDLVKVLRRNGLLPDYLDNSFDQLVATLSSGLPKVRNEEGGHGQGATPRSTPPYVAAYALNLAAAKILFLVKALDDSA